VLALAIAVARTSTIAGAFPPFCIPALHWVDDGGALVSATHFTRYYERAGQLSQTVLAWIYMGVVASALITELVGFTIFGAFLLELRCPRMQV